MVSLTDIIKYSTWPSNRVSKRKRILGLTSEAAISLDFPIRVNGTITCHIFTWTRMWQKVVSLRYTLKVVPVILANALTVWSREQMGLVVKKQN